MKRRTVFTTLAMAMALWQGAGATEQTPGWNLPTIRPVAINWSSCPSALVGTKGSTLGARLRCSQIRVPRDHRNPSVGSMDIAIVRVAAGDPAKRRGAIFFNPGGPGANPMRFLPAIAQYWNDAYADHPVHGTKKQLSDEFDLVGVVPRGLEGGTTFACTSDDPATDYHDPIADRSEANTRAMELFMRAVAAACRDNPLYTYITTEQTVYDMEVVRRSLGEPTLNYYGVSYGTWLGSWYAATYPEHVGRMVLDSSMDWTTDWDTNVDRTKAASQEHFERQVGEPAANDRFRYGLGVDVAAVVAQVERLHKHVRQAWSGSWNSPESLLAAMKISGWLRIEPAITLEALLARMQTYRFHADDTVDKAVRDEATRYSWRVLPPTFVSEPLKLDTLDSLYSAIMCNDFPHAGDTAHHQARIASVAASFPAANGLGMQYHCVYWDGPHATRPPLSRMGGAGDILMVQAEHDPVTPLESAVAGFAITPTAHLIVADGLDRHAVFGFTDSACVEDAVGRYLLRGVLPVERKSHCAAIPAAHGGPGGGFVHPAEAAELRKEISSMRSPFAR